MAIPRPAASSGWACTRIGPEAEPSLTARTTWSANAVSVTVKGVPAWFSALVASSLATNEMSSTSIGSSWKSRCPWTNRRTAATLRGRGAKVIW